MAGPRKTNPSRSVTTPELARIGEAIARRRVELRLTQQAVADLAGVSRSGVQSLEYGTGSIRLSAVVAIADVLGLRLHPVTSAEAEQRTATAEVHRP